MAGNCALCGEKLSFFGCHYLVCANQDETFCSKCHDQLYFMENLERGTYVLEHGKPDHPEEIREFIIRVTERTQNRDALKQELEPPTRPCPNCKEQMERKIQALRIGPDGKGGLSSLWYTNYEVDLYACPECGKVEMYTANFAAVKRRAEEAAAKRAAQQEMAEKARKAAEESPDRVQQEFTSVRPGKSGGKKPPWER